MPPVLIDMLYCSFLFRFSFWIFGQTVCPCDVTSNTSQGHFCVTHGQKITSCFPSAPFTAVAENDEDGDRTEEHAECGHHHVCGRVRAGHIVNHAADGRPERASQRANGIEYSGDRCLILFAVYISFSTFELGNPIII